MMNKFRKILALMLALMMIIVTAPSFADEGETAEIIRDGNGIDEEVTPDNTPAVTE